MARDMVYENVPVVTRRIGDSLLAGANNSTILLGRDRLGPVESGYGAVDSPGGGAGAGAMHLVVGRSGTDPSIESDRATLYLSAKTDPDVAAGTSGIGGVDQVAKSAIVGRADCLRVTARTDMKLSVGAAAICLDSSGKILIDGEISLTLGAANSIIRGEAFQLAFSTHTHVCAAPGSPSGPPVQPLPDSIFNRRVRV